MKNDPLTTALLGALLISALLSLVFFERYIANARELRTITERAAYINNMKNNRAQLNALIADALEYSKKNKDIDPLLESFNLKPGKAAPGAANKPATK
jgi:type II secretory pathway component PulJ